MSRLKSFRLDSEPILRWPCARAHISGVRGVRLNYSGKGMTYKLELDNTSSVERVGAPAQQNFTEWRDVFEPAQMAPVGLRKLAELNRDATAQAICDWVSQYGLLGFWPEVNPCIKGRGNVIPIYIDGAVRICRYEPIECIRSAAKRAANVLALWTALQDSYKTGPGRKSESRIRSVVTVKEDLNDSYMHLRGPIQGLKPKTIGEWIELAKKLPKPEKLKRASAYRVFVNGEPRSQWPIPQSPSAWRRLAYELLAEYIREHLNNNVTVALRVKKQTKDIEAEDRNVEPEPEWNLRPAWHIRSALTAYYVELLMVMRRFRTCKMCGKDISHQKAESTYCGEPSSCRTKAWHRRKAKQNGAPPPPSEQSR